MGNRQHTAIPGVAIGLTLATIALTLAGAGTAQETAAIASLEPLAAGDAGLQLERNPAIPPLGEPSLSAKGVDRGDGFASPTDYPQQRHVIYSPARNTYAAFQEWNGAREFAITGSFWRAFGAWSPEGIASSPDLEVDAGRPSAHETADGALVAYHSTENGSQYGLWVNRYNVNTGEWTGRRRVSQGAGTFPFLERSSDGIWMLVATEDSGGSAVVSYRSDDDGVTWTRHLVADQVTNNWLLPSGAADPSNGDLYISYNNDLDGDGYGDIVIHRSTDGGTTWSPAQAVALGVRGAQMVEPSLVVDRQHRVHLVFQANTATDFSGGLNGLAAVGITGPPQYAVGHFEQNQWVAEYSQALLDRKQLVALPDSCALEPTLENLATDLLTGMVQLGIYRGETGDILYATYNQPYMAVSNEGQVDNCGPWQVFYQSRDLESAGGWSARSQASKITEEQADAGRNAIHVHITQEVPAAGPGLLWSEMENATAPTDVVFARPVVAGPPLQLDLAVHASQVAPGEELPFDFSILNPGADAEAFQVWVDAYDAEGAPDPNNPVFGPADISLDGSTRLRGVGTATIPADTEPGESYRLCLKVGTFPGSVIDEACTEFDVVSP